MTRELLMTEKLTKAFQQHDQRLDQMTDAELDALVDATLPGVPEDLRLQVLDYVTAQWLRNAHEGALGALAAWQPTGRAN